MDPRDRHQEVNHRGEPAVGDHDSRSKQVEERQQWRIGEKFRWKIWWIGTALDTRCNMPATRFSITIELVDTRSRTSAIRCRPPSLQPSGSVYRDDQVRVSSCLSADTRRGWQSRPPPKRATQGRMVYFTQSRPETRVLGFLFLTSLSWTYDPVLETSSENPPSSDSRPTIA
jgi:hypothetical protein